MSPADDGQPPPRSCWRVWCCFRNSADRQILPCKLEVSIDDDKGGADLYSIRIEWALKPFSPEAMRNAISQTPGGPWEDLMRDVRFRGVSFDLDSSLENSFRRAGAPDELLRTIHSSKRQDNFCN